MSPSAEKAARKRLRLAEALQRNAEGWWSRRRVLAAVSKAAAQAAAGDELAAGLLYRTALRAAPVGAAAQEELRAQVHVPAVARGVLIEWSRTRDAALGSLVVEALRDGGLGHPGGVVAHLALLGPVKLAAGNSEIAPDIVRLLDDDDPLVVKQAMNSLRDGDSAFAVPLLAEAWARRRRSELRQLLVLHDTVPSSPPELRAVIALLLGRGDELRGGGAGLADTLLKLQEDPDEAVRGAAVGLMHSIHDDQAAVDRLCAVALASPGLAREVVRRAGYLPAAADPDRALFLFLTEQWDRYAAFDINGMFLSAAYATLNETARKAVRRLAQRSGRAQALRLVLGGDRRSRLRELTEAEATFVIRSLVSAGEHSEAWRTALELPFLWALEAVRALARVGWAPSSNSDVALFEQLRQVTAAKDLGEILRQRLPLAVQRATVHVRGRVNALSFSPDRPMLVIASNARTVGEWDLARGRLAHVHRSFSSSVGHVVALPEGVLVAGERTNRTDKPCAVSLCAERRREMLGTHNGSVTGLALLGNGDVVSSGRDERLNVFSPQAGRSVGRISLPDWPRALAALPGKGADRRVVCLSSSVSLVDLAKGRTVAQTALPSGVATHGAVTVGNDVVVGTGAGRVAVYSVSGSTLHFRGPLSRSSGDRVVGVANVPGKNLVLVAGRNGGVDAFGWPTRARVASVQADEASSLTVSPSGQFLAVGEGEDRASLWDMRVSEVPAMFARPLADASPAALAVLDAAQSDPTVSRDTIIGPALRALNATMRHRFRYDIEVDDLVQIRAGRYDIELG